MNGTPTGVRALALFADARTWSGGLIHLANDQSGVEKRSGSGAYLVGSPRGGGAEEMKARLGVAK